MTRRTFNIQDHSIELTHNAATSLIPLLILTVLWTVSYYTSTFAAVVSFYVQCLPTFAHQHISLPSK